MDDDVERWLRDGGCETCKNTGYITETHGESAVEQLGCPRCYGVGPFVRELLKAHAQLDVLQDEMWLNWLGMPQAVYLIGVAMRIEGRVWWVPRPGRHSDVIRKFIRAARVAGHDTHRIPEKHEQGFITNTGKFVSRKTAARLALKAGQISREKRSLTSEDVW